MTSSPNNNLFYLLSQSPPNNIFQKINENNLFNNNLNLLNYLFLKNYQNNEFIIKEEEKQINKLNKLMETTKTSLNLNNNIILLPVGCHSLNDENHIQLLGTPQTIIPIAVHSNNLNNFPINPLLLEYSTTKILLENNNNCCKLNKKQNNNLLLCHIPIAVKQQKIKEENKNNLINNNDVSCQTEESSLFSSSFSNNNYSSKNEIILNSSSEPLDLSTNNKQKQQNLRKRINNNLINKNKEIISKKAKNDLIVINQKISNLSTTTTINNNNNNLIKNENELIIKTTPEKKFPCDLCGVSFLALETLEGHKKYYCQNRKLSFDNSSLPSSTDEKINKKEKQNLNNKNNLNNNTSLQKQQKNISMICVSCGYKAFTLKGLRNHFRSSHDNIRFNLSLPASCIVNDENEEEIK